MKKFSIYVHIPFCISKCLYCDFNSYANKIELIPTYIATVINNIKTDNTFTKNDICKTIYIGGGTPSYIDSKYIIEILETIYSKYTIDKNVEITIEQNPCSMTKEKLQHYYNIGINRLSIGLQSTNNDMLKVIGRKHNYEEFLEKYNLAKSIGFNNINVDLMLGLPNQKIEDVTNDLKLVIALQPTHISYYSLIIYENTPMYQLIKNNRNIIPSEDVERQMYDIVLDTLKSKGYYQYEISNFSKKDMHSKHNLMCWQQYEYIGFGAGAHSFIDNIRYQNVNDIEEYIYNNKKIILEEMNEQECMKEYMILGLRLINGLDSNRFKEKYHKDVFDVFNKELTYLLNEKYIMLENNQISLTKRGIDYNNYICGQFI